MELKYEIKIILDLIKINLLKLLLNYQKDKTCPLMKNFLVLSLTLFVAKVMNYVNNSTLNDLKIKQTLGVLKTLKVGTCYKV